MTPTTPELLDRLEHSKQVVVTLLVMAEKLKPRREFYGGWSLVFSNTPMCINAAMWNK